MEGVGSRLGRNSSRYGGPTAAASVFNGRVRKWKKKWVHVSTVGSRSSLSNGRGRNNNSGSPSSLLLCKWTPLSPSPSSTAADDTEEVKDSGESEKPPRRRFRYTPIVVLEEREKTAAKKINEKEEDDDDDAEEEEEEEEEEEIEKEDMNQSEARSSPKEIQLNTDIDMNRNQESKAATHLDLGL